MSRTCTGSTCTPLLLGVALPKPVLSGVAGSKEGAALSAPISDMNQKFMSRFQHTDTDFLSNTSSLADPPPHPSDRKVFIEAEQIRLLYEQAPTSFFVTLLNAGLLTIVLRKVVPAHQRFVWLGVMLVITLARITLVYAYRRSAPSVEQAQRWRTWFIMGAGCAGLAWGSAGILLFHPTRLHIKFLLRLCWAA